MAWWADATYLFLGILSRYYLPSTRHYKQIQPVHWQCERRTPSVFPGKMWRCHLPSAYYHKQRTSMYFLPGISSRGRRLPFISDALSPLDAYDVSFFYELVVEAIITAITAVLYLCLEAQSQICSRGCWIFPQIKLQERCQLRLGSSSLFTLACELNL